MRSRTPSRPAGRPRLIEIMPVHLDEHLEAARMRLGRQLVDECQRLRDHETARARPLDGESSGVEPDRPDAGVLEASENPVEIPPAFRVRTSISICSLVNVVQSSSRSPCAVSWAVNGSPGRIVWSASRSDSRAPCGNTRENVRNIPAYGELHARRNPENAASGGKRD